MIGELFLAVSYCSLGDSSDWDRKLDIRDRPNSSRSVLELGELEAAVLGTVVRIGNASARQVAQDLHASRGLAYTTISTTLDRLYKKGILARDEAVGRGGSRYVYRLHSEDKVKGRVVKGFVDRLLTAFGPSIISTLHDYMDEIPKEDLKRLEERVRRESGQR